MCSEPHLTNEETELQKMKYLVQGHIMNVKVCPFYHRKVPISLPLSSSPFLFVPLSVQVRVSCSHCHVGYMLCDFTLLSEKISNVYVVGCSRQIGKHRTSKDNVLFGHFRYWAEIIFPCLLLEVLKKVLKKRKLWEEADVLPAWLKAVCFSTAENNIQSWEDVLRLTVGAIYLSREEGIF